MSDKDNDNSPFIIITHIILYFVYVIAPVVPVVQKMDVTLGPLRLSTG